MGAFLGNSAGFYLMNIGIGILRQLLIDTCSSRK